MYKCDYISKSNQIGKYETEVWNKIERNILFKTRATLILAVVYWNLSYGCEPVTVYTGAPNFQYLL